jgi:hypothetical protein
VPSSTPADRLDQALARDAALSSGAPITSAGGKHDSAGRSARVASEDVDQGRCGGQAGAHQATP